MNKYAMVIASMLVLIGSLPANAFMSNLTKLVAGDEVPFTQEAQDAAVEECSKLHASRMKDPDSFTVLSHRITKQTKTNHQYNTLTLILDANALNGFGGRVRDSFRCNVMVNKEGDLLMVSRRY